MVLDGEDETGAHPEFKREAIALLESSGRPNTSDGGTGGRFSKTRRFVRGCRPRRRSRHLRHLACGSGGCTTGSSSVRVGNPHFTPTSASWSNLAKGWYALLTRRCLQRGIFQSTDALEAAIAANIDLANADSSPFTWIRSANAILASVGRFCQQTSNSDHHAV